MNSKIEIIEEYITKYQAQNLRLKKLLSEQEHSMDERVTAICRDFMQVFDAFDKAEEAIHERGYDQSRLSTQAIQRLLVAKAKLADVLSNYGVQSINLQGMRPNADVAQVVGVEHDDNQEPGTVIRIEHDCRYGISGTQLIHRVKVRVITILIRQDDSLREGV